MAVTEGEKVWYLVARSTHVLRIAVYLVSRCGKCCNELSVAKGTIEPGGPSINNECHKCLARVLMSYLNSSVIMNCLQSLIACALYMVDQKGATLCWHLHFIYFLVTLLKI